MDDFHIIESANEYGITRDVRVEGDQIVTKLTYDAQPFIDMAHAARIATAGDRCHGRPRPAVSFRKHPNQKVRSLGSSYDAGDDACIRCCRAAL